jgi:hypothetical protein
MQVAALKHGVEYAVRVSEKDAEGRTSYRTIRAIVTAVISKRALSHRGLSNADNMVSVLECHTEPDKRKAYSVSVG